jgi:hypothetical protein
MKVSHEIQVTCPKHNPHTTGDEYLKVTDGGFKYDLWIEVETCPKCLAGLQLRADMLEKVVESFELLSKQACEHWCSIDDREGFKCITDCPFKVEDTLTRATALLREDG